MAALALLAALVTSLPLQSAEPRRDQAPDPAPDTAAGTTAGTAADLLAAVDPWRARFAAAVDHRLDVPAAAQARYRALLQAALARAGVADSRLQALLLVDRSVQVQLAAVLLGQPGAKGDGKGDGDWIWLGATRASTGLVGRYDHFRTPLGVFVHSLDNPDFRAEGTFNENGIRGYGLRGLRVFDFGWVETERGWGRGGTSLMRLQVHATDPDLLEPRLGRAASKGCIRIPATLDRFLDQHGLLDADYEAAAAAGRAPWVLRADRTPVPWPGRYLVVVDSGVAERPAWATLPAR